MAAISCKLPQKTVCKPLQCLSESQHMHTTLMGPIIPWKAWVRIHALLPVVPLTRLLTRAGDLLTSQSKKPAGPPDYTEHSTGNTSQKTSKTSKKQDHKVLHPKTTYTRKTIWKSTSSIFSPSMSPELTSEVRMQRSLSALITPSSISL